MLLDAYAAGQLSAVYLCYTRFINTIKQEPVVVQLLPLTAASLAAVAAAEGESTATSAATGAAQHGWDYIYEPDAATVIDELLLRYTEALVFQGPRREHGVGALGTDGRDEGGDRQRRQP